ncbi:D(2) dopamine receptor-like [Anneissia japonica]|uniref:D(2) dopamine receptor-like n=1 Tax=Anneissia japonica TaxID=1529436 RepID=UPI0014256A33|nr:D(2) dopamine receptor-like [Anneissia japonica]
MDLNVSTIFYENINNTMTWNDNNLEYSVDNCTYGLISFEPTNITSQNGFQKRYTSFAYVVLSLLIIWTFFGNTLVLMAVSRERGLKSMSNYVIASLALADLLLSVLVMPIGLINLVTGTWNLGLSICLTYLTLDVLLCTASILHLCAIAVNRYLAVTFPLLYSRDRVNSRSRILGTIIPVWIVSLGISLPLFVQGAINPQNVLRENMCGYFDRVFVIYSSMCSFYLPLAIMIVVDVRAVRKLRGRKLRLSLKMAAKSSAQPMLDGKGEASSSDRSSSNGYQYTMRRATRASISARKLSSARNSTISGEAVKRTMKVLTSKRERRAAKTLVLVFVFFVVLWLPFFVIHLTTAICTSCNVPMELFVIFTWLGYVSSAINPCIYTMLNMDFRHAFLRILCFKSSSHYPRSAETSTSVMYTLKSSFRFRDSG